MRAAYFFSVGVPLRNSTCKGAGQSTLRIFLILPDRLQHIKKLEYLQVNLVQAHQPKRQPTH